MNATVVGQYKASLHLPNVIWDLKMVKEKKSSVKGEIETGRWLSYALSTPLFFFLSTPLDLLSN